MKTSCSVPQHRTSTPLSQSTTPTSPCAPSLPTLDPIVCREGHTLLFSLCITTPCHKCTYSHSSSSFCFCTSIHTPPSVTFRSLCACTHGSCFFWGHHSHFIFSDAAKCWCTLLHSYLPEDFFSTSMHRFTPSSHPPCFLATSQRNTTSPPLLCFLSPSWPL